MNKNVDLDFDLDINKGLDEIYIRISSLHKYLKSDAMSGRFEIAFLPEAGGLDNQDWEWVEDIELVKNIFNSLK